ncbi:MAG: hypothetical protein J6I85_04555 [Clostridia bacterium]|nr:hypothetical protein [Clostridia bacterium]
MKKFLENLVVFIRIFVILAIAATVVAIPAYFLGAIDNPIVFIISNALIFTIASELLAASAESKRKQKNKGRMRDRDW